MEIKFQDNEHDGTSDAIYRKSIKPETGSFGVFIEDKWGQTPGNFLWYKSDYDLRDSILNAMLAYFENERDEDYYRDADELKKFLEATEDVKEIAVGMPDVFYDYEILWSGQPLDLLTGESKFHNRFRKGFMEYLEENEDVYYKEISSQEIIKEKKIKVGEDSVSDEFYKQIMTLPISTELTEYLIKYLSEYED